MNLYRYRTLLIGGGISLVLLITLAVFLVKYMGNYADIKSNMARADTELQRLRSSRPFPSRENISITSTNLLTMEKGLEQLKKRLTDSQVEPLAIRRADFPMLLDRSLSELEKIRDEKGVVFSDKLNFGFQMYTEGALPEPEELPRLTVQVQIVKNLIKLLCEAGVESIDAASREEFEKEKEVVLDDFGGRFGMSGSRFGAPGSRPGMDDLGEAEDTPDPHAELFRKERITLEFTSNDTAFRKLLNLMPRDPMFIKLIEVDLRNDLIPSVQQDQDGRRKPRRPGRNLPATAEFMMTELPEGMPAGLSTNLVVQPHEMRIAAGNELVTVKLVLDVYLFEKDEPEEAESEEAAA